MLPTTHRICRCSLLVTIGNHCIPLLAAVGRSQVQRWIIYFVLSSIGLTRSEGASLNVGCAINVDRVGFEVDTPITGVTVNAFAALRRLNHIPYM